MPIIASLSWGKKVSVGVNQRLHAYICSLDFGDKSINQDPQIHWGVA